MSQYPIIINLPIPQQGAIIIRGGSALPLAPGNVAVLNDGRVVSIRWSAYCEHWHGADRLTEIGRPQRQFLSEISAQNEQLRVPLPLWDHAWMTFKSALPWIWKTTAKTPLRPKRHHSHFGITHG